MGKLVLLRHGKTFWNIKNIFTGWTDIPLAPAGIQEAELAGKKIQDIDFDGVFASSLIRSTMTALIALAYNKHEKTPILIPKGSFDKISQEDVIPVWQTDALNERHYGSLQGKNKLEIKEKFGDERFVAWRRGYRQAPPDGESLEMTKNRVMEFFSEQIVPRLQKNETILVCAHGNSLRGLVMDIEDISEEEIISLEIPTGEPITYVFEEGVWQKTS